MNTDASNEEKMENAILHCIKNRRSVRAYKTEQIAEAELCAVLEAAVWAPSGGNRQSWLFTAIQNREDLEQLNTLVREAFRTWEPDDGYPPKHKARTLSASENYNFFYHAPTLIIASNVPDYCNAMADCSLALGNIFLAARALGLGSCWINQLHWLEHDGKIRAFLARRGIPEDHVLCGAAAIGYPSGPFPSPPSRRERTTRIIR